MKPMTERTRGSLAARSMDGSARWFTSWFICMHSTLVNIQITALESRGETIRAMGFRLIFPVPHDSTPSRTPETERKCRALRGWLLLRLRLYLCAGGGNEFAPGHVGYKSAAATSLLYICQYAAGAAGEGISERCWRAQSEAGNGETVKAVPSPAPLSIIVISCCDDVCGTE